MSGLNKDLSFTKVPNELIDSYLSKLSGAEMAVITYIARKTYGFQKCKDVISISQFQKATGFAPNTIRAAIQELLEIGLVKRKPENRSFLYEIDQTKFNNTMADNTSNIDPSNDDTSILTVLDPSNLESITPHELNPQKSTSKENKKTTTNRVQNNFDDSVQEVIGAWNSRFEVEFDTTNNKLINGVREALVHFSAEEIITAMDNRLQSSYYKNEKPFLLHQPKCFFQYIATIRADLHRMPENIYTFDQKVNLITGKNFKDDDFEIRTDLTDKNGKPKWEYKGR